METLKRLERRHVIFGVVSLALLISTMNLTVAFVVLPQMQDDLGASLTWVGWTNSASWGLWL